MSLPSSALDPLADTMGWHDLRRYGLCAAVVFVVATAALATIGPEASSEAGGTPSNAVLVDLPPALPSALPRETLPEGERQSASEAVSEAPKPAEIRPPEIPPPETSQPPEAPHPAAVLDTTKNRVPDPLPPEPVHPPQEARAPEGSEAPMKEAEATASEASNARARQAVSQWQRAMVQRLEQAKRKAETSFTRTETVVVSFAIDREGRLLRAAIARGSRSPGLDDSALALLKRAAPFPKAPAGIADRDLTFTVPVVFKRRGS